MTDTDKLWIRAGQLGLSCPKLAKRLGISRTSMYNKMVGIAQFNLNEIRELIHVLQLSPEEVIDIFFGDDYLEINGQKVDMRASKVNR